MRISSAKAVAVICVGLLMGTLLWAGTFHGESNFEGAYEFVKLETPDGAQSTQQGMLIVKGDYLCHLRINKEREKMTSEDSDEERDRKAVAAFGSSNSTCGKFVVDGEKITAVWHSTLDPNDAGNSSEFVYTQDGKMLTLAPAATTQFKFVYRKLD